MTFKAMKTGIVFLLLLITGVISYSADAAVPSGSTGSGAWRSWQNPQSIDEITINGVAACNTGRTQRDSTPGITAKIVECTKVVSREATVMFLESFSAFMRPAIMAAIVLAIVLFGVQLSSGAIPAQQIGAKSMILLLQIGAVLYFTTTFTEIPALFNTIDYVQNMIAAPFTLSSNVACAGTSGEDSARIWQCMDTLLARLFALGAGVSLISGVTGFILAALFSGVLGIWLFFFALSAVIMMVFMVLRAINTTIVAFVGMGLLLIIAPIMLPLMLFSSTRQYFQKWVGMIIPFMIQPVILMLFLVIAIGPLSGVIEKQAGRDSFSALIEDVQTYQGNDYIKPSPSFSWQFDIPDQVVDLLGVESRSVDIGKIFTFPRLNFIACGGGGAATYCWDVTVETIQRLIKLMLELLLIGYLMFTVLQSVPQFAASMSGMAVSLASLPVPLQNQVWGAFSGAKSVMTQAAKEGGGINTIARSIPAALTGAAFGAANIRPPQPKDGKKGDKDSGKDKK